MSKSPSGPQLRSPFPDTPKTRRWGRVFDGFDADYKVPDNEAPASPTPQVNVVDQFKNLTISSDAGPSTTPTTEMADPFEVRMRFSSMLQTLNASLTSAQKASAYALKYKDLSEDLHSCILEQLAKNSMNNRANIMFFIEHFTDASKKEGQNNYAEMIERDIFEVVARVTPQGPSGAANVKVVLRVLRALQQKGLLGADLVGELEETLKPRDTAPDEPEPEAAQSVVEIRGDGVNAVKNPRLDNTTVLDKKQKEQRMEEDRERHKRLKEEIWQVPAATTENRDPEFQGVFDEISETASEDITHSKDEEDDRRKSAGDYPEKVTEHGK